jgi:hypothetical protein
MSSTRKKTTLGRAAAFAFNKPSATQKAIEKHLITETETVPKQLAAGNATETSTT